MFLFSAPLCPFQEKFYGATNISEKKDIESFLFFTYWAQLLRLFDKSVFGYMEVNSSVFIVQRTYHLSSTAALRALKMLTLPRC